MQIADKIQIYLNPPKSAEEVADVLNERGHNSTATDGDDTMGIAWAAMILYDFAEGLVLSIPPQYVNV